jgi:hypothetical protein
MHYSIDENEEDSNGSENVRKTSLAIAGKLEY